MDFNYNSYVSMLYVYKFLIFQNGPGSSIVSMCYFIKQIPSFDSQNKINFLHLKI